MRFDSASILNRRELLPWRNGGICGLLGAMFRLCLDVFVLALVLTWIDLYFTKSTPAHFNELVKINAIVALTGLVTMRAIFLALHNWIVLSLLTIIYSRRDYPYEGSIKIFTLLASACAVYFVKSHYIAEAGLIFSYPIAVVIFEMFVVMGLRSGMSSYGVKCG